MWYTHLQKPAFEQSAHQLSVAAHAASAHLVYLHHARSGTLSGGVGDGSDAPT